MAFAAQPRPPDWQAASSVPAPLPEPRHHPLLPSHRRRVRPPGLCWRCNVRPETTPAPSCSCRAPSRGRPCGRSRNRGRRYQPASCRCRCWSGHGPAPGQEAPPTGRSLARYSRTPRSSSILPADPSSYPETVQRLAVPRRENMISVLVVKEEFVLLTAIACRRTPTLDTLPANPVKGLLAAINVPLRHTVSNGDSRNEHFPTPRRSINHETCVVACGGCRSMPVSLSDPRC